MTVPELLNITASVKETAKALTESIRGQATASQLRRLREPRQLEVRRVVQGLRESYETAMSTSQTRTLEEPAGV